MNTAIKYAWLNALRSGEYKQARTVLFDGEGYCCLGVLCRVVGIEPVLGPDLLGMSRHYFYSEGQRNYEILPDPLRIKLGLLRTTQSLLASMNDANGADRKSFSFAEIADYIEANL